MVYRALGISSNPTAQQLELVYASFEVNGQKWAAEIRHTNSISYPVELWHRLEQASLLLAPDYLQLHVDYGHWIAATVKQFIADNQLDYQIQLIGLHGHASIDSPATRMTHQLGDAAAVAAITGINVVSDFKQIDLALGGQASSFYVTVEKNLPLTEDVDKAAFYAAFFALLRWREENNLKSADSNALRDSIGGAVWVGQEW
jgi:anhydro-N-acetylmuramic acid kinase